MAITKELLEEFKKSLLEEKERLQNEINLITKPSFSGDRTVMFDELGSSEDENASEMDEYNDNLAIDNNLKKQLSETTEALEKISQGTYGRCEKCGNEIQIERLQAYPAAKKCLNC